MLAEQTINTTEIANAVRGPQGEAWTREDLVAACSSCPQKKAVANRKTGVRIGLPGGGRLAGKCTRPGGVCFSLEASAAAIAPAPAAPAPEALPALTLQDGDRILSGVVPIPWERIDPSPLNPRKHFAPEQLHELAENIAAVGGVKQNLLVRPRPDAPGRYWLIAGERRHRAVGLLVEAGRAPRDVPMPARVEPDCDDRRHLELAMIENLQREGINPMEEAEGYAALVARGMTAGQIAREILGHPEKTRFVQLRINLVEQLCPEAQEALREGTISVEQARALRQAPVAEQAGHLPKIVGRTWGYETTAAIRRTVQREWERAKDFPKLREAYGARGGSIVTDEESGEEYFADRALLRELQAEDVERKRVELAAQFPWVEVMGDGHRGYYSSYDFERIPGHELAGAVIQIDVNGQLQIHRHVVRKSDLQKVAAGAKVDAQKGKVEAEPWTKAHLARARNRKSLALRVAVSQDPRAAKRLVCLGLLGGRTCVGIGGGDRPGGENTGWNPLSLTMPVEDFGAQALPKGRKLTVSGHGSVYSGHYDSSGADEVALWHALCALDEEALDSLFARLVALRVGTFNSYDPEPGDEPIAVEIARFLGVAGAEAEHGLALEVEDLEGLRKSGLEAVARRAGAQVTGAASMSAKALRDTLAGLVSPPPSLAPPFVVPTLRFGTKDEVVRSMGESGDLDKVREMADCRVADLRRVLVPAPTRKG